jgi:protein-S-isoprenylcysteine O-methyltransferase Ste14
MNLKLASIIAFVVAIAGAVFLYLKGYIFSRNPVTIVIQILAAVIMIWARLTFGIRSFNASANATEGKLVTHGPYRWFRHPIYASLIYFFIGSLIAYPTVEVVLAVLLISSALFVRMMLEEKSLSVTYPEYAEYCKKTKRIVPFIF